VRTPAEMDHTVVEKTNQSQTPMSSPAADGELFDDWTRGDRASKYRQQSSVSVVYLKKVGYSSVIARRPVYGLPTVLVILEVNYLYSVAAYALKRRRQIQCST